MIDLKEKGCEIHTRSAFLQGLFFVDPSTLDDHFLEIESQLETLQQIEPLNGALLKFVIERGFIDKVITGVENEQQLVANVTGVDNAPSLPPLNRKVSDKILIPSRWPKD